MHPTDTTTTPARSRDRIDARRLAPILLAAALGVALIYAAGFAHSSILHNAAHDVRHSAAFPCH